MTPHSDANPHGPWPWLGMKGILRGEGRLKSVWRAGEDCVNSIAQSLDYMAAV
jgi:hypothetical protein